jgi:hypothetical protein
LTRAGERESRETGDKGIKPKLVSKKMKDPNILSQVKFQNYDVPSSSLSFLVIMEMSNSINCKGPIWIGVEHSSIFCLNYKPL